MLCTQSYPPTKIERSGTEESRCVFSPKYLSKIYLINYLMSL